MPKGIIISTGIYFIITISSMGCNKPASSMSSEAYVEMLNQTLPALNPVQYLDSLSTISTRLKAQLGRDKSTGNELDLEYFLYASKNLIVEKHVLNRITDLIQTALESKDSVNYYKLIVRKPAVLIETAACKSLDDLLDTEHFILNNSAKFNHQDFYLLYLKLSSAYSGFGNHEVSTFILNRALINCLENKDLVGAIKLNINLGNDAIGLNNNAVALKHLEQALNYHLIDKIPIDPSTFNVLSFNLISCYISTGNLSTALELIRFCKLRMELNKRKPIYFELFKYMEAWIYFKNGDYSNMDSLMPSIQKASENNELLESLDYSLLNASHAYSKKRYAEAIEILNNNEGYPVLNQISKFESKILRFQIAKANKNLENKENYFSWIKSSLESKNYWTSRTMYDLMRDYLSIEEKQQINLSLEKLKFNYQPSTILIQLFETILLEKNKETIKYKSFSSLANIKEDFQNKKVLGLYLTLILGFLAGIIGVYIWKKRVTDLKAKSELLIHRMEQSKSLFRIANHDYINYLERLKVFVRESGKIDDITFQEIKLKLNDITFLSELQQINKSKSTFNASFIIEDTFELYRKLYQNIDLQVDVQSLIVITQNKVITSKILENLISNSFKHTDKGNKLKISVSLSSENELVFKQFNPISNSDYNRILSHLSASDDSLSGLSIIQKLAYSDGIVISPINEPDSFIYRIQFTPIGTA